MAQPFDYITPFQQASGADSTFKALQMGAQAGVLDQQRALFEAQRKAAEEEALRKQNAEFDRQAFEREKFFIISKPLHLRTRADLEYLLASAPDKTQIDFAQSLMTEDDKLKLEGYKGFTSNLMIAMERSPEVARRMVDERIAAEANPNFQTALKLIRDEMNVSPQFARQSLELAGLNFLGRDWYQGIIDRNEEIRKQEKFPFEMEEKKRAGVPTSIQEAIDYVNLTPKQQETFNSLIRLKNPPAITKIDISNVEKGAGAELAKLVPELYGQANDAATLAEDIPRYRAALERAIVGPFATQRLSIERIASVLGISGEKSAQATTELLQGFAEMSLKSRSLLKGGGISDFETKLLIRARSGDLNMTKSELTTLLNVFDRAARAQYTQSTNLLRAASGRSETAGLFLDTVRPLPPSAEAGPPAGQPGANQPRAGGRSSVAPPPGFVEDRR